MKTASLVKDVLADEQLEQLRDACKCSRDLALVDLCAAKAIMFGKIHRKPNKRVLRSHYLPIWRTVDAAPTILLHGQPTCQFLCERARSFMLITNALVVVFDLFQIRGVAKAVIQL